MNRLFPTKKIFLLFFVPYLFCQIVSGQPDFSGLDSKLENYRRQMGNNVVALVYQNGRIIFSKEMGSFTSSTIEPVASCSKWLTAAMIMTFVDDGKLSLDDSIGKYLPVFTQHGKGGITIRQCMSHLTGFESRPFSLLTLMATVHKQKKLGSLGAEVEDFAKHTALIAKPGTEFRYGNIGLNIAGHILEVISGKSFESIFEERIAKPLGMVNTNFDGGNGIINPSGSARSTADDYLKFLVMILDKGVFRGLRILSEWAIGEMQKPQTNLSMIKYAPKAADGFNYALGEWVQSIDEKGNSTAVACPGLFGTWPLVDLTHHYACIFFVKTMLSEQKKNIDAELKGEIDRVMARENKTP